MRRPPFRELPRKDRDRILRLMRAKRRCGSFWLPEKPVKYAPDVIRTMRFENEFLSGTAVWARKDGIWTCRSADPCLRWMLHMDPATAKLNATKRGFKWAWE